MNDPEVLFIYEALVLGHGETDLNMLLIKNADGSYRKANGEDLVKLADKAPSFIKRTQDYHRED